MSAAFTSLDDAELMHRISAGSHPAFAELVTRHSSMYYRLAYRTLYRKGDAEDVVQSAFIKLWKRPELWAPDRGVKFTTWFYRVVVNLCLDYNKKRSALPLSDGYEMADDTPLADEQLVTNEEQQKLEQWIAALPDRQKLALNLCFYEGLSNIEAAEIMDIHVKALESLLMRAKKTLKAKAQAWQDKEAA